PEQVVGLLDLPVQSVPETSVQRTARQSAGARFKIAGFGGQGVLSLGVMLATAGMKEGYHVSWLPSYGPEMRGGTAHCHVILSEREIGTPLVDSPDVLVAMNGPSLAPFQSEVGEDGLIVYDSSILRQPVQSGAAQWLGVPASKLAHQLGEPKVA